MIVDAETYLENNPEMKKKYWESGNKLTEDSRVTRLGSFIRNKSVDELSQFWNVFKGDMSLVGLRSILDFDRKEYGEGLNYLWLSKPGITGYWVTNRRSKILYPERAELELKYQKSHSFGFDLLLLVQTVVQMFKVS